MAKNNKQEITAGNANDWQSEIWEHSTEIHAGRKNVVGSTQKPTSKTSFQMIGLKVKGTGVLVGIGERPPGRNR